MNNNHIDLDGFVNVTPERHTTQGGRTNKCYISVRDKSIAFSSVSRKSMEKVLRVRVMINKDKKQILVLESKDGTSFWRKSNRSQIIWSSHGLLDSIRSMLPEDRKSGVRILGEPVEIDGKRGLLYSCDNLE